MKAPPLTIFKSSKVFADKSAESVGPQNKVGLNNSAHILTALIFLCNTLENFLKGYLTEIPREKHIVRVVKSLVGF